MAFADSVYYLTTRQFYGTDILVIPSYIAYVFSLMFMKLTGYNLTSALNYLNTVLATLLAYFIHDRCGCCNVFLLVVSGVITFGHTLKLPPLDNRIFGAIFLLLYLQFFKTDWEMILGIFAAWSDIFNIPFVIGYLIHRWYANILNSYVRGHPISKHIYELIFRLGVLLCSFLTIALIDFKVCRNQYSPYVDQFHIGLRNHYVWNPTHKYIMDRSEIILMGVRHRNIYEKIIVEKVHDNDDIGENERFVRYGDEIKLQRIRILGEDEITEWLEVMDEHDEKFTFTRWTSTPQDQTTTLFIIEGGNPGSLLMAREIFNLRHKDTGALLCVKFDLQLYLSNYARKESYQLLIQNNDNHPYYLKHFKDTKCSEYKEKYIVKMRKRLLLDLFIYFQFNTSYSETKLHIFQLLFLIIGVSTIMLYIMLHILSVKYASIHNIFNQILELSFRDIFLSLISIALFGCNFYTIFLVWYPFVIQFYRRLYFLWFEKKFNSCNVRKQYRKSN